MKIAFIVDSFPKISETFILNQITGLIERGHEVDIYADNPTNENKVHSDVEKYSLIAKTHYVKRPSNKVVSALNAIKLSLLNFHKNPAVVLRSWNYTKYDRQRAFSKFMLPHLVIPLLQNSEYDIIHCHFGQNGLKGAFLKNLGLLKGNLLTTFHGQDITKYPKVVGEGIYDCLFDTGDLFLPISKRWQNRLVELGCNEKKIIVHRMGIDCSKFSFKPRYLNSDGRIRLVTIARLVEKKGVDYAIRAVAKLAKTNRNIEYSVVGDGLLRESLQQLIQELGVNDTIKLLGWKQQQEVIEILNNATIMLAPSVTSKDGDQEGIPVGLMEAMAVGLPVVSTHHSGIPELVEDGVSGFLVPERDVDALAERLGYLIDRPEMWSEMGWAGRKHVENFYDINKLNDQLVDIYQSLLMQK